MMAIIVAPSRGIAVCFPMSVRASNLDLSGFLRSIRIPSIITMALSTNIPIARMNAPSETRCIVPPAAERNRNEPQTVISRLIPMIIPLLMPIANIRMRITMAIDSIRLMRNVPRASFTLSGWKNTL